MKAAEVKKALKALLAAKPESLPKAEMAKDGLQFSLDVKGYHTISVVPTTSYVGWRETEHVYKGVKVSVNGLYGEITRSAQTFAFGKNGTLNAKGIWSCVERFTKAVHELHKKRDAKEANQKQRLSAAETIIKGAKLKDATKDLRVRTDADGPVEITTDGSNGEHAAIKVSACEPTKASVTLNGYFSKPRLLALLRELDDDAHVHVRTITVNLSATSAQGLLRETFLHDEGSA